MVDVMIGIDPHKGSHTAFAWKPARRSSARSGSAPRSDRSTDCWNGLVAGRIGAGRSRALAVWDICSRNNYSPPANAFWTYRLKPAARVRLLSTGQVNKNDPRRTASTTSATLFLMALRFPRPTGRARVQRAR